VHRAAFSGRDFAVPDDVVRIVLPALRHRLVPTFTAEAEGMSNDDLIRRALAEVPRPSGSLL
jgi:MoxR-like ATPase